MKKVCFVGNSLVSRICSSILGPLAEVSVVSSREILNPENLETILRADVIVFAHGSSVNGDLSVARSSRLVPLRALKDYKREDQYSVLVSSCILPASNVRDTSHFGATSASVIEVQKEFEDRFDCYFGGSGALVVRLGTVRESFLESVERLSKTILIKRIRPSDDLFVRFADFEWVKQMGKVSQGGVIEAASDCVELRSLLRETLGNEGLFTLSPVWYCRLLETLGVRPVFLFRRSDFLPHQ